MNNPKPEMQQDLTHHKTEETDTLVKAENPADDFMRERRLDPKTHGKETAKSEEVDDEESDSSS